MLSLPLIQPYNVFSAGFSSLCPRLKRAAGRYSSLDPVAHQFSFHAQQQVCRQALSKLSRIIIHPFALSLSGSHLASTKARKVFHDGGKASHETGQSSQEQSHV